MPTFLEIISVDIFVTNVDTDEKARHLSAILENNEYIRCATVDYEDCDHVLRIEHTGLDLQKIIHTVHSCGYTCMEMMD